MTRGRRRMEAENMGDDGSAGSRPGQGGALGAWIRSNLGVEHRIVVLTGAGVSADSGHPTFRGSGGLWEGRRVEEVASPDAWASEPALVWRFYQERRQRLAETEPNAAHLALAELEERLKAVEVGFCLITQNVDNLHARAGSAPIHIHGELSVLRCEVCGEKVRDLEHLDPEVFVPCPECSHKAMRPDVVWFGEMPYRIEDVFRQVGNASLFLAAGTSGVVYPAAGLLQLARDGGASTFVNSLDEPENLSGEDEFVPGRAAEVLPELCERLAVEVGA